MTKLTYTVRLATAPGETEAARVPVLVNRKAPVTLTKVVENAIDRGRILGAKAAASEEIARGIAEQLYWAFSHGLGVRFGEYFYGRLYLDGTTTPNGALNAKQNAVNVKLMKGDEFKLSLDDFSLGYEGADDQPKVDSLASTGRGAMPPRNVLKQGESVVVNGRFLKLDGDTAKVVIKEVGGDSSVEVASFTSSGPDSINFAWPATLDATKSYEVTVFRTAEDGTERASNGKRVTIEQSATPPAEVSISRIVTPDIEEQGVSKLTIGAVPIKIEGENLTLGEGDALYVKNSGEYVEIPLSFVNRNTATAIDLEEHETDVIWPWLAEEVGYESGDSLTFKLVSHGGVPSSEAQVVTHAATLE